MQPCLDARAVPRLREEKYIVRRGPQAPEGRFSARAAVGKAGARISPEKV